MFYRCVKIFIKDSLLYYFHGLWRCKPLDISKCSMSWVTIFRCVKNRLIPKYMSHFRIGGNSITSASNWVVVIDLRIHYSPHIRIINIYQWSHFEIHRLYMIHSGCKSSGNIFFDHILDCIEHTWLKGKKRRYVFFIISSGVSKTLTPLLILSKQKGKQNVLFSKSTHSVIDSTDFITKFTNSIMRDRIEWIIFYFTIQTGWFIKVVSKPF